MEIWMWIIVAIVVLYFTYSIPKALREGQDRLRSGLGYMQWNYEVTDRHLNKIESEIGNGVPVNSEQIRELYMGHMEYRRIAGIEAETEGQSQQPGMQTMLSKISQQSDRYRLLVDATSRLLESQGYPATPYRDLSVPFEPYSGPGALPFDFGKRNGR